MKKLLPLYLLTLAFAMIFIGCADEYSQRFSPTPTAFGKANRVVVIADSSLWSSAVGDTFRYEFSSAYPILPQPEPIFDLNHFTPRQLAQDEIRKELRTYVILADLEDKDSPTTQFVLKDLGNEQAILTNNGGATNTRVVRDRWAKGQILIYMYANGKDELKEVIQKNYPAAAQRINKADEKQIAASAFQAGRNKDLEEEIKNTFGINILIPKEFFLAINDKHTVWIRKETEYQSTNIMIQKLKYDSQGQFSKEYMRSMRDTLGKHYVSTELNNTYMRTNDVDLPMITRKVNIEDYYVLEARGIWDIVNDYMGGPFVSYMIHKPGSDEIIFIDGFIHAPGKKKRKFMQNLEYIINTIRLE